MSNQVKRSAGRPPKSTFKLGEEELRKMRKILAPHTDQACLIIVNAMLEANSKKDTENAVKLAKEVLDRIVVVQRELERKGSKNLRSSGGDGPDGYDNEPRGAVLSLTVDNT